MRICSLSDTHRQHQKIKIEKCDLFIFAGDAEINSLSALHDFKEWLLSIDAKEIIVIFGNHDTEAERLGRCFLKSYFKSNDIIYLENETVEIEGLKIWGSPFSKEFNAWAFMKESYYLKPIWESIPNDTDIVITHGPAFGICDNVYPSNENHGCKELRKVIDKIQPKFHICGHLHESYGQITNKTKTINCSVLNEKYELVNNPIYFEI